MSAAEPCLSAQVSSRGEFINVLSFRNKVFRSSSAVRKVEFHTKIYSPSLFDARAKGGFVPQSCIVLRNSEASNYFIQQLVPTKAF